MKYLIRILALIGSIFVLNAIPSMANAACTPFTMYVTGPAVVNVDPTVAVGTILYAQDASVAATTADPACVGGVAVLTYQGVGAVNPSDNTYPTSIAGVGLRLKYNSGSLSNGTWFPWSTPSTNWSLGAIGAHSVHVEFVKTGPITASGSVSGLFSTWVASGTPGGTHDGIWGQYVWASPVFFDVAVPTCTVSTPSIAVPLGSVPLSNFTGVGSTTASTPLNIQLACSGGIGASVTNVYTTLTDQTNPGNTSDTLSLTPQSTATGVGIQVLNGSTVIQYGPDSSAAGNTNQWFAGAAGNGTFNIPLTARYVQTGSSVTPGTANGRATFTMSYQ